MEPQNTSIPRPQSAPEPPAKLARPIAATKAPEQAMDADVIEREWVGRAKSIVHAYRDDPFTQALELNKLRAEYMKKRYNKEIKLPDF